MRAHRLEAPLVSPLRRGIHDATGMPLLLAGGHQRPSASVERAVMANVRAFYDDLAPLYHLVYENWDASIAVQGGALASLIAERWGKDARVVLDAAVGIGTQALGLLMRGFDVVGSDISLGAVQRAGREAAARGLRRRYFVADFRALAARAQSVDVVLVADNSLPHLDSEGEIKTALWRVGELMREVGFEDVERIDGRFFQPVLAGTRPRRF